MNTIRLRQLLGLALLASYFYWQLPFLYHQIVQQDWSNDFLTLSSCCVGVTITALPWVLAGNQIALGLLSSAIVFSGAVPIVGAVWGEFLPSIETLGVALSLGFYGGSVWVLLKNMTPNEVNKANYKRFLLWFGNAACYFYIFFMAATFFIHWTIPSYTFNIADKLCVILLPIIIFTFFTRPKHRDWLVPALIALQGAIELLSKTISGELHDDTITLFAIHILIALVTFACWRVAVETDCIDGNQIT